MDVNVGDSTVEATISYGGRASLVRHTIWFALGSVAGKAIALITLPILTRLLSPAEFGRLDVLNAMVSAGLLTLLLGTDVAATRLYFDRMQIRERRELFGTWYILSAAVVAPVSLALMIEAGPVSEFLFGTRLLAFAVALVGVVLFSGTIHVITLGVLRTSGRSRDYGLLEGGALVVNAMLAVALLVLWRPDSSAVMLALAVSWSGAAILGLVAVRSNIGVRPTMAAAKDLLRLGLPLAPAVAAACGADFVNRAYLLGVAGAEQAGFLSIAIRFASVAGLVVAATQLAWQPHAYRLGAAPSELARLGVEARRIVLTLAVCVAALATIAPEAIRILGAGRYSEAGPAVGWCLVGVLGTGLFAVVSLPSTIAKATRDIGWAVLAGIVATLALNFVVAPETGATGTAAAIATGQGVMVVAALAVGRRHPRFALASRGVVAILVATIAVTAIATAAPDVPAAVRLVVACGYLGLVWAEGTIPNGLRQTLHTRGPGV